MSVYEKLMQIQKAIKVPKTHKNDFGNFNFRNAYTRHSKRWKNSTGYS